MITAVDSSVLLDIATNDARYGSRSVDAFKSARIQGRLIVSEFVIAEVAPICGAQTSAFLSSLSVNFVPSTQSSALRAGELFGAYLERGGKRGRIVADFLIGAHAEEHAGRLLTRDGGFLRDYFSSVVAWYP